VGLLKGVTPLVPIADIYQSGIPFIGHHHEFTAAELRDLGRLSGLRLVRERFYNYSPHVLPSLRTVLRHPLWFLAFALPTSREVIAMAFCSKEGPPE